MLSLERRLQIEAEREREVLQGELLEEKELSTEEIGRMIGEMDPDKVRRIIKRPRRLSHAAILHTFERLGVQVTRGTNHWKLKNEHGKAIFPNKHSGKKSRGKRGKGFYETCMISARETLHISDEDFYAKLK